MKMNLVWLAAITVCAIATVGCGPVDEEARKKYAQEMLVAMRQSVDLNGPEIPDVEVGDQMPVTSGVDINGNAIALSAHAGKVILLSFWGGG